MIALRKHCEERPTWLPYIPWGHDTWTFFAPHHLRWDRIAESVETWQGQTRDYDRCHPFVKNPVSQGVKCGQITGVDSRSLQNYRPGYMTTKPTSGLNSTVVLRTVQFLLLLSGVLRTWEFPGLCPKDNLRLVRGWLFSRTKLQVLQKLSLSNN